MIIGALVAVTLLAADGGVPPAKLRVLVRQADEFLPPQADPVARELELLGAFAAQNGYSLERVPVERYAELIPALLDGRGDVIAAGLTVTKERQRDVAFTRPTRSVDELLVGQKGAKGLPKKPADLAGRRVAVPKGSAFVETIAALKQQVPTLELEEIEGTLPADQLAWDVAHGKRALTVVDSLRLDAMRAYMPELEPLFPLASERAIAYALRPKDTALRAKLDAWLIERAFQHDGRTATGDLDVIKKRGTLRVLTRNNAVSFYLYRGERLGFDYELAKMFAASQGLTLEVVVAPSYDALLPMLQEGKGDLIAASLTVTPEREQQVAFSRPYLFVKELVVQRKGAPKVARLEELAGRKITVRRSSSYAERLRPLAAQHGFTLVDADEDAEVEDLVADVGDGAAELTVADSHFLDAELLFRDDIEAAFELSNDRPIAFALRKDTPKLQAAVDAFVKRAYRGLEYNVIKKRCFENRRQLSAARDADSAKTGRLSPFDEVIKKYSTSYGFDWRLMSAQAWRESRFDPKAKSWVGALGLFQVMPATGKEMGFTKLLDVDTGTHAGVKYMSGLVKRFEPSLPLDEKVRFALAAYNAGFGRVEDARRLAQELKLDPDTWKGNVEKSLGLLARPKYARRARGGFCRCQEPVDYVNIIENKYESFLQLVPRD